MCRYGKAWSILWVILIMGFALVSCSSNANGATEMPSHSDSNQKENQSQNAEGNSDMEVRRLVKNFSVSADTENFDDAIAWIGQSALEADGYVGSSQITSEPGWSDDLRKATYIIRIPSEQAEAYLALLKEHVRVTSEESSVNDVTGSYTDLRARLDSLTAQEQRVLELLASAPDLDTILKLDDKLTGIRSEIEQIQSQLKLLENKTEYATFSIVLYEVEDENAASSFAEQLKETFIKSWTDFGKGWLSFFVMLVAIFPTLLVLSGIAALIIFLIRITARKRKKRQEALRMAYMQQYDDEKQS